MPLVGAKSVLIRAPNSNICQIRCKIVAFYLNIIFKHETKLPYCCLLLNNFEPIDINQVDTWKLRIFIQELGKQRDLHRGTGFTFASL